MKILRSKRLAFVLLVTPVLLIPSACTFESGYGYGGGYDGSVGIGVDYYEPFGYDYGGWGGTYRSGPPRGGFQRVDDGNHASRPAPAAPGMPSIPSGPRRGGGCRGGGRAEPERSPPLTSLSTWSFDGSLRFLRTRRFGTFVFARLLSNIGIWARQVAQPSLSLSLGASSVIVGLDAIAQGAPAWMPALACSRIECRRVIVTVARLVVKRGWRPPSAH